jgi:hypothetical protein
MSPRLIRLVVCPELIAGVDRGVDEKRVLLLHIWRLLLLLLLSVLLLPMLMRLLLLLLLLLPMLMRLLLSVLLLPMLMRLMLLLIRARIRRINLWKPPPQHRRKILLLSIQWCVRRGYLLQEIWVSLGVSWMRVGDGDAGV